MHTSTALEKQTAGRPRTQQERTHRLYIATEFDPVVPARASQRHVKAHVLCCQLLVLVDHVPAGALRDGLQEVGVLQYAAVGKA